MNGRPDSERVELEDVADLDRHLSSTGSLAGTVLQALDLRDRHAELAHADVRGAVFLGCRLDQQTAEDLRRRGAMVFATFPDLPFDPYRARLYTPDELYAGLEDGYDATPDAKAYHWMKRQTPGDLLASVQMALHDASITDALDEVVLPDPAASVGIMGGHAVERGSADYRAAARLAAHLTTGGRPVLTGGGPGAMEAANLGASLSEPGLEVDEVRLEAACDRLAEVPSFRPIEEGGQGITAWARQAFVVREEFQPRGMSLGIPTWFYGHEPPNAFASTIAKYFSNAIREDVLLWKCRGGIIYLPGAAGTVQEIFQAATGNYYAGPGPQPAPMVLVGVQHWTQTLPAWPLLEALGRGRPMGEHLYLVDSIEDAADVLDQ